MTRAEEEIKKYDSQWNKLANFRSLWQATADLCFPRENNITHIYAQGVEKMTHADDTAIIDSKEMSDGLLSAIIPAGEHFFQLNASKYNPSSTNNMYVEYLSYATDRLHNELFSSNYLLQMGETMRSVIVFGTGDIFSEYNINIKKLNFKDYDISLYVILENEAGIVDVHMLKVPYTARQAYQKWGDKAGKSVLEAVADSKKENDIFQFLHIVKPREKFNPRFVTYWNTPFESRYINIKDKTIVDEGGFFEFPYQTPRWMKTTGEIMGRGQGTEGLKQIRMLNQQRVDFNECSNKHVNPAMDVLASFEGDYRVFPGARNDVSEFPTAVPVELKGNFPVSKDTLEMEREIIHTIFYKDVFHPLRDLKGDRRTTLEIRERLLEGLKRIGQPVHRLWYELFNPQLSRCLNLCIRNGIIEEPPPGLDLVEIEPLGLMANALSSGQATAFQRWIAIGVELKKDIPEILDNVNIDEGYRNLGRKMGVRLEDINKPEVRDEIRRVRQEQIDARQAAELAQMAGQAYGQATGAPEKGSPAAALMGS
ncbi:MAG: hypothetical protein JXA96_17320 [Sedimentisphaerales bacterium]|nr:hypothetical protein [Sedimentisphaerales bacterium]